MTPRAPHYLPKAATATPNARGLSGCSTNGPFCGERARQAANKHAVEGGACVSTHIALTEPSGKKLRKAGSPFVDLQAFELWVDWQGTKPVKAVLRLNSGAALVEVIIKPEAEPAGLFLRIGRGPAVEMCDRAEQ